MHWDITLTSGTHSRESEKTLGGGGFDWSDSRLSGQLFDCHRKTGGNSWNGPSASLVLVASSGPPRDDRESACYRPSLAA